MIIQIFSSERRHNCVILLSFITVTCVSQLPDDLSSTCASTCEEWAPAWCDHDWSAIGCVVSSSGVVKDYCRSACENCNGAYIALYNTIIIILFNKTPIKYLWYYQTIDLRQMLQWRCVAYGRQYPVCLLGR